MSNIDQATHAALNFPLTRIAARYQQLYDVPPHDLARHERELKRYLVLRSRLNAETLPTPKALDQLWHVFLLYTRDYMTFCDMLGGFIHHVPGDAAHGVEKRSEDARLYGELLAFYEEMFRETPPADVWPSMDAVSSALADCDASGGNKVFEVADCDSALEGFEAR
jgi:hypothetical protein